MATQYRVLEDYTGRTEKLPANAKVWVELGENVEATNDEQAVKATTSDRKPAECNGRFVGVPERHFNPGEREVELKPHDTYKRSKPPRPRQPRQQQLA